MAWSRCGLRCPSAPPLPAHTGMQIPFCSSCRSDWGQPCMAPISEMMDVLLASKRRRHRRRTQGRESARARLGGEGGPPAAFFMKSLADGPQRKAGPSRGRWERRAGTPSLVEETLFLSQGTTGLIREVCLHPQGARNLMRQVTILALKDLPVLWTR